MQRHGSLAMVSPCSSSSKQMVHSPESLDRMSSGESRADSRGRVSLELISNLPRDRVHIPSRLLNPKRNKVLD